MKMKLLLALAALGFACTPGVAHTDTQPATVAVFDPTTGSIPLPNDLALQPGAAAALPQAQQQLLAAFTAKGGFPSDQEVPVTISFQTQTVAADGTVSGTAPDLDFSTFRLVPDPKPTLLVFLQTSAGIGPVAIDPINPATDYVKGSTSGTLTLHRQGHAPWPPGEVIVAIRGGTNGVHVAGGQPVVASSTFFLIAQGQDLSTEQNLALLRAQAGSTAAAQVLAAQLNQLVALYRDGTVPNSGKGPFALVNQFFPQQELAIMTTFAIAPAKTQVALDPNRGLVPLPIDLLRDPRPVGSCPTCGLITPLAACTLAAGQFNPATGACSSPAAAGFETLDGFSTTGLIVAQTSTDLVPNIMAVTVTPQTVQLYDLSDPAHPAKVDPATYITEPAELQQQGFSPVIALQPAGATSGDPTSVFRTRPLKENTSYAVVISNGVKDQAGNDLAPGTVASILQITAPLVDKSGNSQLSGVDNPTAGALEVMRQQLGPVYTAAAANGIPKANVVMAYTFKTQSFLTIAAQLGALPYINPTANLQPVADPNNAIYCNPGVVGLLPGCPAGAPTVATVFSRYGLPASVPNSHIGTVFDTTIATFNKLLCNAGDSTCHDTGAFNGATVAPVLEPVHAVIALPLPPYGGTCVPSPTTLCDLPLVVFRHGLNSWRGSMLPLADTFVQAGFAVAAIDANKFGDRSFCSQDAECNGTCVHDPALAGEGDPAGLTPGHCSNGVRRQTQICPTCDNSEANPVTSGEFFISSNFFRTRDSQRQDIIDQSQLARILSPNPFCDTTKGPADPLTCANNVISAGAGVQIDPAQIFFVGQSLGAIDGTMDVAAIPRFSRAVLNVGGGTQVDVFTNSPSFVGLTNQLLASLGIQQGANSKFLQFLVVAKTILDPADPVNYAEHLTANTLPNLLANQSGSVAQAPKAILTQAAFCDQVVPNPFNFILDSTIACGPASSCASGPALAFAAPPATPNHFELFFRGSSAPNAAQLSACPAPPNGGGGTTGAVAHAFLTDFSAPTVTAQAQSDAAAFLVDPNTLPPTVRNVP